MADYRCDNIPTRPLKISKACKKFMNYSQSPEILSEIKKAKRILLNCHHYPDADSVGSATALYLVLKQLGKEVDIVCPSPIPDNFLFLPISKEVKQIDFSKFDFSDYDLFITNDSASWNRVTGARNLPLPKITVINIDHHKMNIGFGKINLIEGNISSNSEILFKLFFDWNIEIDNETAESLLTGIIGDTGALRLNGTNVETLEVMKELIIKGANKDRVMLNLFQSYDINVVGVWTELLKRMKIDNNFVWSAIPYEIYKQYGEPVNAKEEIANMVFQNMKGTDFGWVMIEYKDHIGVSFRSRTGVDVAKIASKLGGGGHTWASACRMSGVEFGEAVEKVLRVVKNIPTKI